MQRETRFQDAVVDFHRRKRVDMHSGKGAFDGPQQVAVEISVKVARQAALNADFRGTAIPRLTRTTYDFFKRKGISIGGLRSPAKSAKTAAHEANVGEVYVAIDDVGNRFADSIAPQMIRDGHQRVKTHAFSGRKLQALLERKLFAGKSRVQRITDARRAQRKSSLQGFQWSGFVSRQWGHDLILRWSSRRWRSVLSISSSS